MSGWGLTHWQNDDAGGSVKSAMSYSFSERLKKTLGNLFTFTMGAGSGDKIDIQEEGDIKEEDDYYG